MSLDTFSAVLLAIGFLVPGFVLSSVLAMTFRRRSNSPADLTIQYLTLSCVNHGFWSWLIALMLHDDWFLQRPVVSSFLAFVILFVSPIAFGVLATAFSQKPWAPQLLAAFGFKLHRFIPTAWDFKFGQEKAAWLIVRLKDGSTVFGYFGSSSFAGDEPQDRDLYLEEVYTLDDSGQWTRVADTGGILIPATEIASVEFRGLTAVSEIEDDKLQGRASQN